MSHTLTGHGDGEGDRAMAAEDEPVICEICKQGRVTKRMEEMAFRQWSDKGYIQCRVKSLEPGSDKILDEAFRREYDKLP